MTTAAPAGAPVTRGPLTLWLALATGPVATTLQLFVGYALVKWACDARGSWLLATIAVAALLLALAGATLAAIHLLAANTGDDHALLWSAHSRGLLAAIALGLDLLVAMFLVSSLIAMAGLSPCE